jgi:HEAT repeat protein
VVRPVPVAAARLAGVPVGVRATAAGALGEFGRAAQEAVPDLATAASAHPAPTEIRVAAINALGKVLGPGPQPPDPQHLDQGVKALIVCLSSKDAGPVVHAARVLGEIGTPARAALPALEQVLTQYPQELPFFYPPIRLTVSEAVRKIKGEANR